jgi:uncharacterized protein
MDVAVDETKLAAKAKARKRAQMRAGFLRETVRWHWISAAICLVGIVLFAVTGITLNHARQIEAKPAVTTREATAPAPVIKALQAAETAKGALPGVAQAWLNKDLKLDAPKAAAIEWSDGEAYIALPRPGGDGWVTIDTETGATEAELTSRGWISYFNDLHKGRNTGPVWAWFLDIFAAGCIVFCVTGLILLFMHAHARKTTWWYVGLGLFIPLVLALHFMP